MAATPDHLLLDVQDPGSATVKGSHSASLGTLPFKASTDLADFKDPVIADRDKSKLIIVNCALGGQALLGAKMLVDYVGPLRRSNPGRAAHPAPSSDPGLCNPCINRASPT
eukprot:2178108-Prymnesium_polylepis.1